MENIEELSDFEIDALKETANIGTGHASIALSALMNKKVNINIPTTDVVNMHEVYSKVAQEKETVVGIYSKVKEGMNGNIIMLLPLGCAMKLVREINSDNTEEIKDSLKEKDVTVLKKLGSVLYSAYLSALANFFEQNIIFQTPSIVSTFGDSIIDFILLQVGEQEKVLLITINFTVEDTDINGNFLLLFTISSLFPLLGKLKKKMGMA
jgi:chemotaxis protein CheC